MVKSFDEYWAEEEAVLKISLEVSRKNKAERLNKKPGRKIMDQIEGRINDSGTQTSDSKSGSPKASD